MKQNSCIMFVILIRLFEIFLSWKKIFRTDFEYWIVLLLDCIWNFCALFIQWKNLSKISNRPSFSFAKFVLLIQNFRRIIFLSKSRISYTRQFPSAIQRNRRPFIFQKDLENSLQYLATDTKSDESHRIA